MSRKRFGSERSYYRQSFETEERESEGMRSGYKRVEVEKRRRRQTIMDKNNTDEAEELGQDSVNNVISALSRREWFPWLGEVYQEEDRLGDADWKDKTDV